jgi:TPR repeat protein
MVGFAYRQGIGVPKNSPLGERYYEKAAKAGLLEAQFNLGTLYLNSGQLDKALPWLKSAAERGSTPAQNNLAQLYLQEGIHYDESAAFVWFLKAAEAGHVEAQYNTCHMYSAGEGVARNEVEAYKWCDIAATSSHEKATKNRDYIAKRMTPQQIERAKMLSQQWVSNLRR